ncbi:MAG: hypothetical protein K5839_03235 [Treponemataceae bacterium]|nr:hypothetical protein [Treponemataceae bacterium]
MKKKLLLILFAFLNLSLWSQELEFSGTLETCWALTAPWTEEAWDFSCGDIAFTGKIDAYYEKSSLLIEGKIGYDCVQTAFLYDLNEAYYDYSSDNWGFRIGRQKVAWGKADGIDISNAVFPSDSTSIFLDDDKIGIDAARLSLSFDWFTADFYWIPFFTSNKLPLSQNNPLRKYLVPETFEYEFMGTTYTFDVELEDFTKPELNIKNCEYAAKMSAYTSICDLSLYGYYGWDKNPLLDYSINFAEQTITVSGDYKPLSMFALDAAFPVWEFVLRLESAVFPFRFMQASDEYITESEDNENYIRKHQMRSLAGLDWMGSGWTITAQYYCDYVFEGIENLKRQDEYEHGISFSLSKSVLNDTLSFDLAFLLGLNDYDSAIEFETQYAVTDQINLALGTYVFLAGVDDGTYGQYKNLSNFYFLGQYKF